MFAWCETGRGHCGAFDMRMADEAMLLATQTDSTSGSVKVLQGSHKPSAFTVFLCRSRLHHSIVTCITSRLVLHDVISQISAFYYSTQTHLCMDRQTQAYPFPQRQLNRHEHETPLTLSGASPCRVC